MIKTIDILPYEVSDALQDFLLRNQEFEQYLNDRGYTNTKTDPAFKKVNYIHYPKQTLAIQEFPFVTFEFLESTDNRGRKDGLRWEGTIIIGLKDLDSEDINSVDHEKTVDDNVVKYTANRKAQDLGKKIIETIGEEIEFTGIKGDYEIKFGRIYQETTPTGEFDPVYHMIELELISHKEI
jgi:hypothetical protein